MEKPCCKVRNLHKSALSGYVSEADAIATGGHYITPDGTGWLDVSLSHDLCVTCANCGSVVSSPGAGAQLICSDCGMEDFHVVQTVAPPPRRPTYTPLVPPSAPSNPSPRSADDDPNDSTFVSPWARWAARTLDLAVSTIFGFIVVGIFLAIIGCDIENISDAGAMIMGIPAGLLLDALCYQIFGWTLGKWLFAVKVRHHDGFRLTFGEYFKRNCWMTIKGLGLCIPIVTLITEVVQYNRLRAGKCASYDEGNDIKILRAKHDVVRTVFGIVALIVLFIITVACNV